MNAVDIDVISLAIHKQLTVTKYLRKACLNQKLKPKIRWTIMTLTAYLFRYEKITS